ncbi:MAG: hypothetical protein QNJ65_08040 [Xenococcaceae cyanobacterium MO_234.B1]|nr:hypothetical protein [Xenococcaceae cyanobacterium MO_234.B1]
MLYINLGFSVSPRQLSVAILKGNDISKSWRVTEAFPDQRSLV